MWTEIDAQQKELSRRPFDDAVKREIEALLASLPTLESLSSPADKAALMLRRGRARLLFPQASKEAELELQKALKFAPEDPEVWLAISESMWKRNSPQESRDALASALRVNPHHAAALSQQSRILRTLSAQPGLLPDERASLLTESVESAKKAVAADVNDGDAWSAVGVGVLQQAVVNGLHFLQLRKALAALNKAAQFSPWNADVFYNRAVVRRCLGRYAQAAADFQKAFDMDPRGLSGARAMSLGTLKMLEHVSRLIHEVDGETRRIVAKMASKSSVALRAAAESKEKSVVSVSVVGLLSPPGDQPLAFVVVDKDMTIGVLLVSCVGPAALKRGDLVTLSAPPSSLEIVRQSSDDSDDPSAVAVPVIHVDATAILVGGVPLPAAELRGAQLTTRQFQ